MITVAPRHRASAAICAPQREAVHVRHASHRRRRGRTARAARGLAQRLKRGRRAVGRLGLHAPAASISCRMRRFVALSSTTSTRRSRVWPPAGDLARRRPGRRTGPRNGTGCRGPASLSARCARPSARRAAPRSSDPARCRRTGASSTRRPARTRRRSCHCLSGGMPMPVSETLKCSAASPVVALLAATLHDDLAALGELDRVADEIDQHLTQPARVADQRRRARPAGCGTPARALSRARAARAA